MATEKKNYKITNIGTFAELFQKERVMLGTELAATGCEISANSLPAGQSIPFVHSHKENEEIYIILRGNGRFMVDQDEFPIQEGSFVRVAPTGKRVLTAGTEELIYLCLQVQQNSLKQATMEDGVIGEEKASWMK